MSSAEGPETQVVRSFCRLCGASCGTLVTTDGTTVFRIAGDSEHPVSRGYTCPKGRAAPELSRRPDRLQKPLVRRGDRLLEASWEAALDDLAERLLATRNGHGVDAVGTYQGTGRAYDPASTFTFQALRQALGSRSRYSSVTVDMPNKLLVPELMSGMTWLMPAVDHARVELLVYMGTNPVVSHGHINSLADPVNRIRDVKRRGEVWVIDTRRTETARLATRHLAPRSGSDYALLAHVIRELLRSGGEAANLRHHSIGMENLRSAIEPFDLAKTTELTGLTPEEIGDFVSAVRRFGRLVIETGTGVSMTPAGNVTEWLKWVLEIVTGSTDPVAGPRWFNAGWMAPLPNATVASVSTEAPGPPSRPELKARFGEYPCSAMADEIEQKNLHALLVLGGNPVIALPDESRIKRALCTLDVLAVWDIVPTATTELATHVLPAVDTLERADILGGLGIAQPVVFTQYTPAVIAPSGSRRPPWWSLDQLGRRMGLSVLAGQVDSDTACDDDILQLVAARGRVRWDELRAADGPVIVSGPDYGWVERFVLPDGKWRLAPALLVEQLASLESAAPLVLQNRRQLRQTNSLLSEGQDRRVHINSEDAARTGVTDGALVRVASATGSLVGRAKVDDAIRIGAISIPHGFADVNVERLTSARVGVDPLTGMPRYVGEPITIEPVENDTDQIDQSGPGVTRRS